MRVENKVIVDPNPVAPDGNGGFQKIIGEQESSGQILTGLLRPARGWSRRSAGCRFARCPRPHGGSPRARRCSAPPTTTTRATWPQT